MGGDGLLGLSESHVDGGGRDDLLGLLESHELLAEVPKRLMGEEDGFAGENRTIRLCGELSGGRDESKKVQFIKRPG